MPKHLQKFTIGAFALAVATVAVQSAAAESRRGETAAKIGVASQATVVTDCGASIGSRVTTSNTLVRTSSTSFATLAATTLEVPSGTRCVKVVFTAETTCEGDASVNDCFVRATDNGVEMNPQGGGTQIMDSESVDPAGHAYEWVRRVGPGTHVFRIQVRVGSGLSDFFLDEWTFDVQNYR